MIKIIKVERPIIACAGFRSIMVGTRYDKLPNYVKKAVIAHEEGHIKGNHTLVRLLTSLLLPAILFRIVCRHQEFQADKHAVNAGHTLGLLFLLKEEKEADFISPSHSERRNKINSKWPRKGQ